MKIKNTLNYQLLNLLHWMNKTLKYAALFFFILCNLVAYGQVEFKRSLIDTPITNNCPKGVLQIGWHSYYPYSFIDPDNGNLSGKDIDLISDMLNKMDCKYSFSYMTWERNLKEIDKSNIDIGMYAFKNKEREKDFVFSEPYRNEVVGIAILSVNQNKWNINSLFDFKKHDMIVAADTHAFAGDEFEEFKALYSGIHIIHVHGLERRFKMLMSGRVDAIIADPIGLEIAASKLSASSDYFIDDYIIYESPVHFIFKTNDSNKSFVEKLNYYIDQYH